jgi:hypothetical protein
LTIAFIERPQLSRFGPRERRASKRIRRWAEVGFSAKLGPACDRQLVDNSSVQRDDACVEKRSTETERRRGLLLAIRRLRILKRADLTKLLELLEAASLQTRVDWSALSLEAHRVCEMEGLSDREVAIAMSAFNLYVHNLFGGAHSWHRA